MRTLLLAALACASVAGCGGGDEKHEQSQREALDGVLSSFSDQASNPKSLKVWFTDGKAPADKDLKAYQNKMYMVADEPTVDGTTATASVQITNEKTGSEIGKLTWTFAKDGEKWKIVSAPLR